ncbi:xylosyltransferase oxt-like [Watersipora subatra]|uniref:xylosyltransferase oxt-like n=1 Tax=Watersipora subatra TaxID=2589382 RepID=UPI00355AFDE1
MLRRTYHVCKTVLPSSHSNWDPDKHRKKIVDDLYKQSKVSCEGFLNKDAHSAIARAKTTECKEAIERASCLLHHNKLFPASLPRYCPLKEGGAGEYIGCYKDDPRKRDLSGPTAASSTDNSPIYCRNLCLASGYRYAGVQYGVECFCGNTYGKYEKLDESNCGHPCPSNDTLICGGFNAMNIYSTGYGSRPQGTQVEVRAPAVLDVETSKMVRILFMFTWNGRAWRQVKRLFKQLYHVNHYYYIHVDAREEYLYRQVLILTEKYDNVRVVSERVATIWGGSSLLQMLLHTMKEALDMKDWRWDFYLNLSESDYPVKSLEELTAFLTANKGKNFLKSHGPDTPMFLKKQGLLRTFYECEYHLWRMGNRSVPTGIRIDGGSDWICLSRNFIQYLTVSQDELIQGLRQYFTYALLPAESYFHTVLQNSEYCETFIDNNLHKTNWNRKRGCLCQYRHIVDWCGCSPIDFTDSRTDQDKLQKTKESATFFARKFEAAVNNQIVNWLDEFLHSTYPAGTVGLSFYWQNVFHAEDSWKTSDDLQYTYYMSHVRNTVNKLVQVNEAKQCAMNVLTIQQVHFLTEMSAMNGMLVHYTGRFDSGRPVDWEVYVKPQDKFVLIKPLGAIARITDMKVGSVFDIKERIFRDYGQMLSSNTDNLTVIQVWQGGLGINVTLLLTDPLGRIAYLHNVTVPQGMDNIIVTKVHLVKPMLPGQWHAKLVYQNVFVAKTSYLVLPELYSKRLLPPKFSVSYDYSPYSVPISNELLSFYNEIISDGEEAMYTTSQHQSLLEGSMSSLMAWCDKIVSDFWKPNSVCSIKPPAECEIIPLCNETSWSSFSPDPKSELGEINPRTGKITQLIS